MTANYRARAIFGGSAGAHQLGSETYGDAGVAIAGGVVTLTTSSNHRWAPRCGSVIDGSPPAYAQQAIAYQFVIQRVASSGATHTLFDQGGLDADLKITADSSGVLSFRVAGVAIGTWASDTSAHHGYMIANKVGGGTTGAVWAVNDSVRVTIAIDRIVLFDQIIVAVNANTASALCGPLTFGQTAVAGAGSYKISHFSCGYTDRAANIGKLTVSEWGILLGATPPAGYDQGNKSTGTDGAALVDERPPTATAMTDTDFYQVIQSTNVKQAVALAASFIAAGAALYSVIMKVWHRTGGSAKLTAMIVGMHDGTNVSLIGAGLLITSPSNYAEYLNGATLPWIANAAPDGTAWSSKTNVNGYFVDTEDSGTTANEINNVDVIVVEGAQVLAGQEISLTPVFERRSLVLQAPAPLEGPSRTRPFFIGLLSQPAAVAAAPVYLWRRRPPIVEPELQPRAVPSWLGVLAQPAPAVAGPVHTWRARPAQLEPDLRPRVVAPWLGILAQPSAAPVAPIHLWHRTVTPLVSEERPRQPQLNGGFIAAANRTRRRTSMMV